MKTLPLGTLKPTEYLARLRALADEATLNNAIFQADLLAIWRAAMPAEWRQILVVEKDIDTAASKADVLHQFKQQSSVAASADVAVTQSTPSQQPSNIASLEMRFAAYDKRLFDLTEEMYKIKIAISESGNVQSAERGHRPFKGRSNNNSRSRSRSQSAQKRNDQPDPCYYHWRFGNDAYRCAPGCRFFQQQNQPQQQQQQQKQQQQLPQNFQ
ncbi:Hypothetical predicted protein [Cloeon dipterum]|uniref:Uncharacterized protein n=1 Tax=Cloeon dipterum TaxID=197152 RepID=A0A8S1E2C7_9INSE|nr:Hypothetical predicted protein [Cloeon dipterum]